MCKLNKLKEVLTEMKSEISKVIIGQDQVVDLCLVTIFSRSHALIEGVPGIAKTLLIRTLANILSCDSKRIQFTPDLMPADILGTNVFNLQQNSFTLVKGPVFTTLLLADEINRATAKTQSALLQAMQERIVSIDGVDYKLPECFTVFATQNPIEYEGTYPLPEAQKDRFLLKIDMDYPEETEELELAARIIQNNSPEKILESGEVKNIVSIEELIELREGLNEVIIKEELLNYILQIVRKTREHEFILVGAGPRATQALVLASRVNAIICGRDFVTPDDVKFLAMPVLSHRLILRPEFEIEGLSIKEVINQILEKVVVPR